MSIGAGAPAEGVTRHPGSGAAWEPRFLIRNQRIPRKFAGLFQPVPLREPASASIDARQETLARKASMVASRMRCSCEESLSTCRRRRSFGANEE